MPIASWVVPAVLGGATWLGGREQRKGNEAAGRAALTGQREALAATERGNRLAVDQLRTLEAQGQPGVSYFQRVVARDPYTLTPAQRTAEKDLRREANARLAKSGLRGSGRAVTASFNDLLNRFRGAAVETNLGRGDRAAGALTGQATSAGTNIANIYAGGGQQAGQIALAGGETAGNLLSSNAALNAETMGSLAGIFAGERDRQNRESRYRELMDVLRS
jgi:hypothetical protein